MSVRDNPQRITLGIPVVAPGAARSAIALAPLPAPRDGDIAGSDWREPALPVAVGAIVAIAAVAIAVVARLGADATLLGVFSATMAVLGGIAAAAMWFSLARGRHSARGAEVWRAIGDALPFPCCAVDGSGRTVYANGGFRSWFPDAGHAPLAHLKQRLGGDAAAGDLLGRLTAGAGKGIPMSEDYAVDAAGGNVWYRVSAHPLDAGAGLVLWLVEDVTDRRHAHRLLFGG
mgnify:FL=1